MIHFRRLNGNIHPRHYRVWGKMKLRLIVLAHLRSFVSHCKITESRLLFDWLWALRVVLWASFAHIIFEMLGENVSERESKEEKIKTHWNETDIYVNQIVDLFPLAMEWTWRTKNLSKSNRVQSIIVFGILVFFFSLSHAFYAAFILAFHLQFICWHYFPCVVWLSFQCRWSKRNSTESEIENWIAEDLYDG